MRQVNWGIIGCGSIAQKFMDDIQLLEGAKCIAAASRSIDRATTFCNRNQIPKAYGSYQELVEDESVEVVYIATRHVHHHKATMLALEHGKAVMCEKPFGMNREEVNQMVAKAKEKQVFLMEALWTRFLPVTQKALELVVSGEIGEVLHVHADFGFPGNPTSLRHFEKHLGGGSLLDIGIYPIFMAQLFLGPPDEIEANAVFSEQEIDLSCGMSFQYQSGKQAFLSSTLQLFTQNQAWIHGTKGSLLFHPMFHMTDTLSLYRDLKRVDDFYLTKLGHGYAHEILHVSDCLRKGLLESPMFSHQNSFDLIDSLDRVRAEIGLEY